MLEHAGAALVLAHFLDRMLAQRPAKQAEAPAWFEAAAALVRDRLAELTRGAAQVPGCFGMPICCKWCLCQLAC